MEEFQAGFLSLHPQELVSFLLAEAGQLEREAVNPVDLLSYLGLAHLAFDFSAELPGELTSHAAPPRALLSFPDRIVATDEPLHPMRTRFSVFHEIAHFVLPNHEYALYLDTDECLSFQSRLQLEQEANAFAAALMFKGDEFTLEANSHPISAASVKRLANRYQNSFEATCRRFVERNLRPALMAVFEEAGGAASIDVDRKSIWSIRYCSTSATFRNTFFTEMRGVVPDDVAAKLATPGRDIGNSAVVETVARGPDGERRPFRAEFFTNSYNIFCLLTPP